MIETITSHFSQFGSNDFLKVDSKEAKPAVGIVKHAKKIIESLCGHISVSAESAVDVFTYLTNYRTHSKQGFDYRGRRDLVKWDRVEIYSHFRQQLSVEMESPVSNIMKRCSVPVEKLNDQHKSFQDVSGNGARRSCHAQRMKRPIEALKSTGVFKLTSSLVGGNPSGGEYSYKSANCLRPTRPVRFAEAVLNPFTNKKAGQGRGDRPKLDRLAFKKDSQNYHFGIVTCGPELTCLQLQPLNQLPQRRRRFAVVSPRQSLISEVLRGHRQRLVAGIVEPVAIGRNLGNAANEEAIRAAGLPVVRVVNADDRANVPVQVLAFGGLFHCSRIQLHQQQRLTELANVFEYVSVLALRAKNVATVVINFWQRIVEIELCLAFLALDHDDLRFKQGIVA